jgi:hypothetical protein
VNNHSGDFLEVHYSKDYQVVIQAYHLSVVVNEKENLHHHQAQLVVKALVKEHFLVDL